MSHYEVHGWSPKYFTPALKKEIGWRLQDRVMFGWDWPTLTLERLDRGLARARLRRGSVREDLPSQRRGVLPRRGAQVTAMARHARRSQRNSGRSPPADSVTPVAIGRAGGGRLRLVRASRRKTPTSPPRWPCGRNLHGSDSHGVGASAALHARAARQTIKARRNYNHADDCRAAR